jgi:hypothetical protein
MAKRKLQESINMDEAINIYCQARDHVLSGLPQMIEVFMTGMWSPFLKHNLIRETTDIIQKELIELFPNLPSKHLPRSRFRIFEEDHTLEAAVQNYYNHEPELTFLGTTMIGQELFDCYYRGSYDPRYEYMFVSRYGHGEQDYYVGSKTAAAEYYLGQETPLSLAYGLAIEDGFIG